MDPSQISVTVFMVSVAFAIIVWLLSSQKAASARRMMGMMTRVGLDPGSAAPGDPRAGAVMTEARQRCRKCPREDFCERWLAGEVEGDNTFCRSAEILRGLTEAGGYSA